MKALLAICMIVASTFAGAAGSPAAMSPAATPAAAAPAVSVTGKVLEVKHASSYTYLRIKTQNGETWAAVMEAKVKKGATVTIENVMVMNNFESKALKKTFPTILFGTLGGAAGSAPMGHGMGKPAAGVKLDNIHVSKASGENAHTVAEIYSMSATLKDKPVVLHAKVVKYNAGIMGKNWVHLRDGTGSDADGSSDILATSSKTATLGDVVTVKGTIRTDKDFGSGYAYKVLIDDAMFQ